MAYNAYVKLEVSVGRIISIWIQQFSETNIAVFITSKQNLDPILNVHIR